MPSRQTGPGGQRPGPHPARPGRIDAAFDQGRDRKGEADGKADIAEVKQRRMDGEPDILQHRIEVAALARRRIEPVERIGRQQDEQRRRRPRSRPGRPARWLSASPADCLPNMATSAEEEGQDQHPQQHRAFVVAPDAGELVDQRDLRMRILPDVLRRKNPTSHGVGQRREGEGDNGKEQDGADRADLHQRPVATPGAENRHDRQDHAIASASTSA